METGGRGRPASAVPRLNQVLLMFQYTGLQKQAMRLLGGGAGHVMLFGGSRSGKTFAVCCALALRALKAPGGRHAVLRRHFNSVRTSIGLDTMPKVLRLRFPGVRFEYSRTDNCFRFPNRSEIWLLGLDDAARAEKILGKEFATLYFNETSELDYRTVQLALTRLAQNVPGLRNRAYYDCNPPGVRHWSHRIFIEHAEPGDGTALKNPENYASLLMNPVSNRANLPPGYIENTLAALPRRERERFLEGKWLDDNAGALWSSAVISSCRALFAPDDAERVVVGVDPAVTGHSASDLTGIVVCALKDGEYYVLEDSSCRGKPEKWMAAALSCYRRHRADLIVAEVNNGGELVETLLRHFAPDVSYRAVRASRGKIARAEPVAALYSAGRAHHAGVFAELEDEMTSYTGTAGEPSPDRMDALVWAVTELMNTRESGFCAID